MYIIQNRRDRQEFWRKGGGWGSRQHASQFSEMETERLPLPPGGEWVEIPNFYAAETEA